MSGHGAQSFQNHDFLTRVKYWVLWTIWIAHNHVAFNKPPIDKYAYFRLSLHNSLHDR